MHTTAHEERRLFAALDLCTVTTPKTASQHADTECLALYNATSIGLGSTYRLQYADCTLQTASSHLRSCGEFYSRRMSERYYR